MALFYGEDINVGDQVYCIVVGQYGTVSHIIAKEIRVRFGKGRRPLEIRFDQIGRDRVTGAHTGFWHDPVVVMPTKNVDKWSTKARAVKAAFTLLEVK